MTREERARKLTRNDPEGSDRSCRPNHELKAVYLRNESDRDAKIKPDQKVKEEF